MWKYIHPTGFGKNYGPTIMVWIVSVTCLILPWIEQVKRDLWLYSVFPQFSLFSTTEWLIWSAPSMRWYPLLWGSLGSPPAPTGDLYRSDSILKSLYQDMQGFLLFLHTSLPVVRSNRAVIVRLSRHKLPWCCFMLQPQATLMRPHTSFWRLEADRLDVTSCLRKWVPVPLIFPGVPRLHPSLDVSITLCSPRFHTERGKVRTCFCLNFNCLFFITCSPPWLKRVMSQPFLPFMLEYPSSFVSPLFSSCIMAQEHDLKVG